MNCISGSKIVALLVLCAACGAPTSEAEPASEQYSLDYTLSPDPDNNTVLVEVELHQSGGLLREMRFSLDSRITDLEASGDLQLTSNEAIWQPGDRGGKFSWVVRINNKRNDNGHDAWMEQDWGIFRAEDVIPRARTRALKSATSDTTLTFELPAQWSAITEYTSKLDPAPVSRPGRLFSQPTGWIAVGVLGTRREMISGIRVAITGPQGHSVRRMDMLALLNWTLPELDALLGNAPDRLTIFSADEPMWRGGLSAPASIFVHADRPLISENATSTLLHEVMHVALSIDGAENHDWIVEGLAEYYSLELLHRGGAISSARYKTALEDQKTWSAEADGLCAPRSSGANTALAVVTFRRLDLEIRKATAGAANLDNVVNALNEQEQPVSLALLKRTAEEIADSELATLNIDKLPGCRNIDEDTGS